MNYQQHIVEARLCLASQELLMEYGSKLVAAEAIWGAAIQVINAANHARGVSRHPRNNATRVYVVEQLLSGSGLGDDLSIALHDIIRKLHTHFYNGHLNDTELRAELSEGINFVNRMIEVLDEEHTEI